MRNFRLKSLSVMFSVWLVSFGCSEQKRVAVPAPATPPVATVPAQTAVSEKAVEPSHSPALTATESKPAKPEADLPVVETKSDQKPAVATEKPKEAVEPNPLARPFAEVAYLPDGVVGLFGAHPKQFASSPIGRLVNDDIIYDIDSKYSQLMKQTGVKFEDVERITVLVDQTQINMFARQFGLPVSGGEAIEMRENKNALTQIGLAFHNYHDSFKRFPRADGDAEGKQTGLSWRVHLLPFLDQRPLYNEFYLDEAWDSERNKPLIARMPAVFKTPGVTDEGKTAFHVFTGENTLFPGKGAIGIGNVKDGTSNTILAVLAGTDTAEIWTKPGGLKVDFSAPKKALGEIKKDEELLFLIADGSVAEISADIDETTLTNLIKPADGNVVDIRLLAPVDELIPSAIFALERDVTQAEFIKIKGVLGDATEETHEGETFFKNRRIAVWQPDLRTVIAGRTETVKKIISAKRAGKASTSPLIGQLRLSADFTSAIDLESQASLFGSLVQFNPMMGMVSNIKTLASHVSAAAKVGDSLIEINVTAVDEGMAGGLFAMSSLGLNQWKSGVSQLSLPPDASASDKEMQAFIKNLVASATVKQDADKIQLRVPAPKGIDRVIQLLKPALIDAKASAKETQQRNAFRHAFRQLGLAFHNFHDAMAKLPGAGRNRQEGPIGLSWRVHLLPYLNQVHLYNQFKLDEPWDSEHNKTLIEKMPPIFKSPGVDEVGKTTIHVFTGPGAPFANDKTPGFREFTDGTSVTILAVLAGPETADFWTKPGGLDFDPKDPIKSLGTISGEMVLAVFADAVVRELDKEINATILRRWIQFADGEPVKIP